MSQEDFQAEVVNAFQAAAPRTLARRRAAGHRPRGVIEVHGNNNTVTIAPPGDPAPPQPRRLEQLLEHARPWSLLFAKVYSVICAIWLAVALLDIDQAAGSILYIGEWVRANGLFILPQAALGAGLLAATIVGPCWLFSRQTSSAAD